MDFDFSPIVENWRFFAGGLGITVALSVITAVSSILLGLAIALLRLYGPRWLRPLLVFYIDSMRAIPVLAVLVWIYFAFPLLVGVNFAPFWGALIALTLHIAAYAAEVIRAGIESVRPGQMRAGVALGMSRAQALRKIILPQALIRMLPALGSVLTLTIKDTAIATVIAVPELMHKAETVAGQSYRPIEIYTAVSIAYFVLLFPVTRGVERLYQRYAHLGRS
jgi:polar amino acid transport system permease protein